MKTLTLTTQSLQAKTAVKTTELTGVPLLTCFLLIHVGTNGLSGRQNISVIPVVNQSGIAMPGENYSPARVDEFRRMNE